MKGSKIVLAGIIILISLGLSSAQLGQSSGNLEFGKIHLNESETLSYLLINSENNSLKFNVEHPKDVKVEPENGTIKGKSQQRIRVSAKPEKIGNFSGSIKAKVMLPSKKTGVANFEVEMKKEYSYEAIPEPKKEEKEKGISLGEDFATVVGIILLISGLLFYNSIKGGK